MEFILLVLSRRKEQHVVIGEPPNEIIITVVGIGPDRVRLGITAPRGVPVHRGEVYELIHTTHKVTTQGVVSKPSVEHMQPGQETN